MRLVIDRSKWAVGTYKGAGSFSQGVLLEPETGKMCCLGFLAKACGASDADIGNYGMPSDVAIVKPNAGIQWPDGIIDADDREVMRDTCITNRLAQRNDHIKDEGREDDIAALFAEVGVEVEFVG